MLCRGDGGHAGTGRAVAASVDAHIDAVEAAVKHVTGTKLKSMAAGQMGYSTSEVGDLVAETVAKG